MAIVAGDIATRVVPVVTQPVIMFVAVKVYTVVTLGQAIVVTAVGVDKPATGDHWYVTNLARPQLPLIVVQEPAQSVAEGLMHKDGFGTTVTVATTEVPGQLPLVPVTVYDVVAPGVTVMQLLVAPVLQV